MPDLEEEVNLKTAAATTSSSPRIRTQRQNKLRTDRLGTVQGGDSQHQSSSSKRKGRCVARNTSTEKSGKGAGISIETDWKNGRNTTSERGRERTATEAVTRKDFKHRFEKVKTPGNSGGIEIQVNT